MSELVFRTVGKQIPSTHNGGSKPVCSVYGTVGIVCKGAEVLKRGSGIGDYLVILWILTSGC